MTSEKLWDLAMKWEEYAEQTRCGVDVHDGSSVFDEAGQAIFNCSKELQEILIAEKIRYK